MVTKGNTRALVDSQHTHVRRLHTVTHTHVHMHTVTHAHTHAHTRAHTHTRVHAKLGGS